MNYKKYIFILVLLWTISIMSWCGTNSHFEYNFESFYGSFNTINSFTETTIQAQWLSSDLLKDDIITTYIQNNTGSNANTYQDSIIIIKKNSTKDLTTFVQDDIQKTKLNWFSHKDVDSTKIKCNEQKLELNIVDSELEWNLNTTYFTQAFIQKQNTIYILSFSSQNESERDSFSENTKKINCK